MPDDEPVLCKAERLAIASYAAPRLRGDVDKNARRRVTLINQDTGAVTGYTTVSAVQQAMLAKHAVEFEVAEDGRPPTALCRCCGHNYWTKEKEKVVAGSGTCAKCLTNAWSCSVCGASLSKTARRRCLKENRRAICRGCLCKDPEHKAKLKAASKNACSTPEYREKLKAVTTAYWAKRKACAKEDGAHDPDNAA